MDDRTAVLRPASSSQGARSSSSNGRPELVQGFDREAGQTWIYPMNKEYREYQFNIVRKSLFQNTLICLPTGLGKTFIAAVLMYNFYRWFPRAKVIFMAPTKPLVAQQMGACFEVMGIPQDHMCEMTGSISPGIREIAWHEKRVFFLTPQIIANDISREICPANLVCCVVIDEAHKALGNHAYVQVVQELLKYNGGHFRVLAMSATPGSGYQQIRQVIQNLLVANVELRSEDSPDIVPYTHTRLVEKVVVPMNDELQEARTSLINVISVYVTRLHQSGCLFHGNPEQLSKFLLLKERERFRQNPPDGLSRLRFGIIEGDFAISISLLHALDLLQFYGLQSFNVYCQELLHGDKGQPTTRYELQHNVTFCMLMDRVKRKFSTSSTLSPSFKFNGYSHPKFQKLEEIVLAHFANTQHKEGEKFVETRIIIFAQYRETVREIETVLNRHKPQVRPIVLLGQGQGSGKCVNQPSTGLKQKVQLQVMTKFRSGECNVLVATCIGEEGLDIGDVDLIICFDAQKSPVRLIQRMGRTGRKRNGRVVILMTQGKEENAHKQGQYNSKVVNQAMASALSPCELYSNNPRMVPSDLEPECRKMFLKCATFIHKRTDKASVTSSAKGWKLQMAESPYLTDAQLAEWKVRFYIPFSQTTHLEMEAKTTCLHTSSAVTRNKDRLRDSKRSILSISEWLPWQNTLQLTFFIEHSKRTELLVDTMKSLEILQYQDGTQCDPQEVTNESLYSMTQLLSIMDHNTMEPTSPKRSSPGEKITLLSKQSQVAITQPNTELAWDSDDDDDFLGEFDMLPFSSTKRDTDAKLIGSDCDTDEIIPPSPKQSPTTAPQFFLKRYKVAGSIGTASTSTPLVPTNIEMRTNDVAAPTPVSPTCRSSVSPSLVGYRVQRKMFPRCRLSEVKVVNSDTETFRPLNSKAFLDDEASVDGGSDNMTSDEASEQCNSFDDAFINDVATQGNYNNTTMYLRSIKSPHCRPGAFKLFGAANNDKRCENVLSQSKSSPESEYLEDSFCVGSNDDYDDESPTEPIPRKRRRIVVASDNSTSSEEPYLKSPGNGPALPNIKPIVPSCGSKTSPIGSESSPVIILVDSQEISSSQNIISELRLKHKAQVIIAQLGSCDYILSRRLAVECKSISDITNGAQHKKLVECVKEMATNYQRWVVLVETRNHDPKTVRATLTRHMANTLVCLVDIGRVIFTSSKEHTAEVLYDLAYSEARSGHALSRRAMDVKNSAIFSFYRKLAMNNYIIALNLLDGFSSPNSLFHCSPKEIADCSKCPFQKAETIFHNIQRVFKTC